MQAVQFIQITPEEMKDAIGSLWPGKNSTNRENLRCQLPAKNSSRWLCRSKKFRQKVFAINQFVMVIFQHFIWGGHVACYRFILLWCKYRPQGRVIKKRNIEEWITINWEIQYRHLPSSYNNTVLPFFVVSDTSRFT